MLFCTLIIRKSLDGCSLVFITWDQLSKGATRKADIEKNNNNKFLTYFRCLEINHLEMLVKPCSSRKNYLLYRAVSSDVMYLVSSVSERLSK